MTLKYIDIHSHVNFSQFDEDRDALIEKMREEGIATITIGTGLKTSHEAVELAEKYTHLFATVGIHPTDANEAFDAAVFENLLMPKVVAVGECGLDYFRFQRPSADTSVHPDHFSFIEKTKIKEKQKALFVQQIEFAQKHKLPLMLHCRASKGTRDAYEEALDILAGYPDVKGNFHFFAGDLTVAKRAIEAGFSLSFDGPITFTNDYDEVIKSVPAEMIHAETDAPFAAPVPHRGKRNEPAFVIPIVGRLAAIRGADIDAFRVQLLTNAKRSFPKLSFGTEA